MFNRKIMVFLLVFLLFLTSCGTDDGKIETPPEDKTVENGEEADENVDVIKKTDPDVVATDIADNSGMTVLDSYEYDFDKDGTYEFVELLTDAERSPTGDMLWDDGHIWKLRVRDGDKEYVLFDDRIQLGVLNHQVYTVNDEFRVSYVISASAETHFVEYGYFKEDDGFKITTGFNTTVGNVNVMHDTFNRKFK